MTDANGSATCTVDEGSTDQFGVSTAGVDATFGGDLAFLPSSAHSPAAGAGGAISGDHDSPVPASSHEPDGEAGHTSASVPTEAAVKSGDGHDSSTTASPTPGDQTTESTTRSLNDTEAAGRSASIPAGNLLVLVVTVGVLLAAVATLVRRRLRAAARAAASGGATRSQRPGAM
jgi:hypothetical protein